MADPRITGAPSELGPHDGHVPAVVARRLVLLVRGVVLLVHDQDAQAGQRREDGRARPHDDVGAAAPDAAPGVESLAALEAAVQDRHPAAEAGQEALDGERCQGDLGDQHQGLPALLQGGLDGLEVHLGLAGAGDAVEQDGREPTRLERLPDDRSASDWAGQHPRNVLGRAGRGEGVPGHLDLADLRPGRPGSTRRGRRGSPRAASARGRPSGPPTSGSQDGALLDGTRRQAQPSSGSTPGAKTQ